MQSAGTTLVAYSPLGRGLLTGSFSKDWQPNGQDFRAGMAMRFKGDAFENNLALVDEIRRVGADVDASPGQVALAWVLQRDDNIVTIPGTTKLTNLKSNLGAADVRLSAAVVAKLDALASKVKGERHDAAGMKTVNG